MKIGLTTGVYDLLHVGHKNLFLQTMEHCDFILVAVASDTLTRAQKGPSRPIEDEATRKLSVQNCLDLLKVPGKAFITEKLCFNDMEEVDVVLLGEDQKNVVWTGDKVRLKRTPGISTSDFIKEDTN